MFPAADPEVRLTLSLDVFTEFSADNERHSTIDESMGVNMLSASVGDDVPGFMDWSYAAFVGGGYTNDEPTRFLQNDVLHGMWGLRTVPRDNTRSGWDYMAGAGLHWDRTGTPFSTTESDSAVRGRVFGGAGVLAGSLYKESFAQLGGELLFPSLGLKVGLMDRMAFPDEGEAFTDVAYFSNIAQIYIGYVPHRVDASSWLMELAGNPEMAILFTKDSGLFMETTRRESIETNFVSVLLKWPSGLIFEAYNDVVNQTDFGPTMGFTFSFDVTTAVRSWR